MSRAEGRGRPGMREKNREFPSSNYQKEFLRSSLIPPTSTGDVMHQPDTKEAARPFTSLLLADQIALAISIHYSY
jgi:hypothetical protein